MLESLGRCLDAESARRLAEFRIDPRVEARMETLGERANEGILSAEERSEYEAMVNAAEFIAILRLKAQRHFGQTER